MIGGAMGKKLSNANPRGEAPAHLRMLQCDHLIILLEEIQMHANMLIKRSRASLPLIRLFYILLIVSLIAIPAGVLAAPGEAPLAEPGREKVIFFSSDGL